MSAASQAIVQPQFRNILFMTDFSPCSAVASPCARAIAGKYGSTVHVLHIVSPTPVVVGGEFGGAGIQVEVENEGTAHARMDEFLKSGAFEGILYTQRIQTGAMWDILPTLVEHLNVDLIILGTHGRRGMQHLLLGSVAEQVYRRAACPVLTVGPNVRKGALSSGKLNTILYATDFSSASLSALDYAVYLARTWEARMILLHSITSDDQANEPVEIGRMNEKLSALMTGSDIKFGVVVGYRQPSEMILATSRNTTADIIIMGAHRGRSASTHAPWAVAHKVVCSAPCPVLTVRAAASGFSPAAACTQSSTRI